MKSFWLVILIAFLTSCSHYGSRGMLKKMDMDGDGKISKQEFTNHKLKKFADMDKNKDGYLSGDELKKCKKCSKKGDKSCCKKDCGKCKDYKKCGPKQCKMNNCTDCKGHQGNKKHHQHTKEEKCKTCDS